MRVDYFGKQRKNDALQMRNTLYRTRNHLIACFWKLTLRKGHKSEVWARRPLRDKLVTPAPRQNTRTQSNSAALPDYSASNLIALIHVRMFSLLESGLSTRRKSYPRGLSTFSHLPVKISLKPLERLEDYTSTVDGTVPRKANKSRILQKIFDDHQDDPRRVRTG